MKKQTNLLNPTPAQVKHRNRLLADALEANPRKACNTMYKNGARCCLAVAQDLAHECGLPNYRGHDGELPHSDVGKFFGWGARTPDFVVNLKHGEEKLSAVEINDGDSCFNNKKDKEKGLTHKQIAECVLNTFVRPKNKKWTFSA